MKKTITLLMATILFAGGQVMAEESNRSYTVEEMHKMASSYITLTDRDHSKTALSFDAAIEAGEFRGYVASLLDNAYPDNEKVAACKSARPIGEIARKSALSIMSSPASGPGDGGKRLRFAVLLACNNEG